ncbi:MAG: acyl-CoA thioesterase [Myxococcales bacterium]|nr:acyl-CoA thioesterase [Myxococcales bacterium]
MFAYERKVHFEDVDAAGIVFFARYLNYCHEAMEAFFGPLEGGYERLITERHIGLPAVHVEVDYRGPLRYGDQVTLHVTIPHVGRSSTKLKYDFFRKRDGAHVATVVHTCAVSDLTILKSITIPDDMRALLLQHAP